MCQPLPSGSSSARRGAGVGGWRSGGGQRSSGDAARKAASFSQLSGYHFGELATIWRVFEVPLHWQQWISNFTCILFYMRGRDLKQHVWWTFVSTFLHSYTCT